MGEPMETDIVSQLHDLSEKKSKPSEVFKEFNIFVESRNEEIAKNVTDILDSFKPGTNVGKILKVKLIDRFRQGPYVVKLLQIDDTLYIAQALKCSWFFEDVENPADFVRQIIPTLSLVTRIKVINKFSTHLKNVNAGEELYRNVKSRYGIKSAEALLPTCGENFIRSELPNLRIYLRPNVALALYNKYPSLGTEYVKYLGDKNKPTTKKHCNLNDYESTYVKLAQTNLEVFVNLYESPVEVPFLSLGRRPTKKLIKTHSTNVLKKYRDYSRILSDKIFLKRLSLAQFKTLLVDNILPSSWEQSSRELIRALRFVRENQRSNLVLSAFKEKYKVDMTSNEILAKLDEYWFDFLPTDAKYKWLEMRLKETTDVTEQARLLYRLPVINAMPKLKKLIESQSDPSVRVKIAKFMLMCVETNKDAKGVEELFAYFVKRFRNEVTSFRDGVRNVMTNLESLYLELNDWTAINDFLNIIKLNGEARFIDDLRKVMKYQIQSAFSGKGDVEVVLKNYLDLERCGLNGEDLNPYMVSTCRDMPCNKSYLEWVMRETSNFQWNEEETHMKFFLSIYDEVNQYNKDHKDQLEIAEYILDDMEHAVNLEETPYNLKEDILRSMRNFPHPKFEKYVKRVFPEVINEPLMCTLLKTDPEKILQHVQKVLNKLTNTGYVCYKNFYKKCRMYDSFGISKVLTNRFQEVMSDVEYAHARVDAVRVMAVLLDPDEYVKVVSEFFPEDKKITEYSEEVKEKFEVQKAICQSFMDVSTPSRMLPVIRKFTEGDFLKLVVSSLVKTCSNLPETEMLSNLEKWMNCPVSLRKHFLRLINDLAPSDYRMETFNNIFKKEKNVSLRLLLFNMLRSAFLDIPDDDSFAIYKSIVSQLTVDDVEAVKKLIDIKGFDDAYISPYLELLWQLVDGKLGEVLRTGKNKIRSCVNEEVVLVLNNGFCDTLMTHEMTTLLPNQKPRFVAVYLLWAQTLDVQQSRLDKVTDILRPMIVNLWDLPSFGNGLVFPIRSVIRGIVTSICRCANEQSILVNPTQMLTGLKTFLSSIIKPTDLLKESIAIDLAIQTRNHRHLSVDDQLKKAWAPLFKSYIDQYGASYGHVLMRAFREHTDSTNAVILATEILSYPESNHFYQLLALEILKDVSCSEENVSSLKSIVTQLSQSEHPSVQVAVNEFFHSLSA